MFPIQVQFLEEVEYRDDKLIIKCRWIEEIEQIDDPAIRKMLALTHAAACIEQAALELQRRYREKRKTSQKQQQPQQQH